MSKITENWYLRAQNKHNRNGFNFYDLQDDVSIIMDGNWILKLKTNEFTTSRIKEFNKEQGYVLTNSGSKYFLGNPINESLLKFLEDFYSSN